MSVQRVVSEDACAKVRRPDTQLAPSIQLKCRKLDAGEGSLWIECESVSIKGTYEKRVTKDLHTKRPILRLTKDLLSSSGACTSMDPDCGVAPQGVIAIHRTPESISRSRLKQIDTDSWGPMIDLGFPPHRLFANSLGCEPENVRQLGLDVGSPTWFCSSRIQNASRCRDIFA